MKDTVKVFVCGLAALCLSLPANPSAAASSSLRIPSGDCATVQVEHDGSLVFSTPSCFLDPDGQLSMWVTLQGMRLLIGASGRCLAADDGEVISVDCGQSGAARWSKAYAGVAGLTLTWDDSYQCLGRHEDRLVMMECNEKQAVEWK